MPHKKKRPKPPRPPPEPKGDGPVQILPYLYLGPRSTSAPATALRHGITHVLSVGCTPDRGDASITYRHLSLRDEPSADLASTIDLAVEIINNAKQRPGARVLVHCIAAVSRSPALVVAYLVREEGLSLRQAMVLLARARANVRPNWGFLRQLRELEVRVRGEESLEIEVLPVEMQERLELLGIREEEPAGGT